MAKQERENTSETIDIQKHSEECINIQYVYAGTYKSTNCTHHKQLRRIFNNPNKRNINLSPCWYEEKEMDSIWTYAKAG